MGVRSLAKLAERTSNTFWMFSGSLRWMKSTTINPPMPRSRNWRPISWAASRLTLALVSSSPVAAVKLPEFTLDGGQRFGAFDGDPAAGFERHAAFAEQFDLGINVVHVEQHAGAAEEFDLGFGLRHRPAAIIAGGASASRSSISTRSTFAPTSSRIVRSTGSRS